ncbi:hypothetical protein [Micromonospora sp. NPDC005652]|uniref:hypothetical protein n=1 Tax=Micromonospora sp. NPDC005652 TaxID=3157046 RepID=UPI0034108603
MAQQDITYVKAHPETGKQMERTASTPTDVVALEFDGWVRKDAKPKASGSSSKSSNS